MAVDCAIVSYNSAEDLPACLRSLAEQQGAEPVVTVVDNNSTDDSVTMARNHGARVLVNTSNRGFAAAVNQGLQGGSSPWVLIINPDAHLMPGGLRTMIDAATRSSHHIGCVGPKTTDTAGVTYPSARSFPGVFTAMIHGLLGSVWPENPATTRYHASNRIRNETSEVDWVSGCCMVLPRQAWDEMGGFDERYFIYVEDMDLCFRLRKSGWRTLFEPNATVVHVGGRSSRHRPLRSIYHHHIGAIRFYWRSASAWHRPLTGPLAALVLLARGVLVGIWAWVSPRR
ncbi:MAG: glycosyltransferase family 2 protein [Actinomycetes bacterium]